MPAIIRVIEVWLMRPFEVPQGGKGTVMVVASNTGDQPGTITAQLTLDGVFLREVTWLVQPGDTASITTSFTVPWEVTPGNYYIYADGVKSNLPLRVLPGEAPPPPPPEEEVPPPEAPPQVPSPSEVGAVLLLGAGGGLAAMSVGSLFYALAQAFLPA